MRPVVRRTAAAIAAGTTLAGTAPALAGNGPHVEGARVRHGRARFERQGDTLRIYSGRLTVVDYDRFDIPVGTSVEFLQANGRSRFLNRINSDAPTQIMGSLMSNGRVYFINRAGVIFGKNATINVGGLFAAAGNMSNKDFLAGRDRVTDMRGEVRNEGTIHAGSEVVLAGRTVVNNGTIETDRGGLVAMVAGDQVTLRRAGSNVSVRVAGGAGALDGQAAIQNNGVISTPGGRTVATTGDLASLAIDLNGTVIAQAIEVDGGAHGTVRVAGTLNASGEANGTQRGGTVEVTGGAVEVAEPARIIADGAQGGGVVHLGGGMQGQDASMRNATTLHVAEGAQISANATQHGDGGEVILWSDDLTYSRGGISVRGAGATGKGGFAEVSGKHHLDFDGVADVRGVDSGINGTLLLDPGFLIVQNTASGVDTIGISTINSQLALGNVVLQNSGASQSSGIQWNATSTLSGLNSSSLTLNAVGTGAAINVTAAPAFGTWAGAFNLNAEGGITIGSSISRTSGAINMTAGAGQVIALNGATVSTSGAVSFNSNVTLGANTTVSAGAGAVTFGGTVTGTGGNRNLTVNTTGATTFAGSLSSIGVLSTNTGGTTSFGGDVSISGSSTLADAVTFTAGAHTLTNTGAFTTTFRNTVGGPGSLTINTGTGTTTFTGAVGGTPLAGLTVNSAGNVTFSSTINGGMPLAVNTTGTTTFTGAVGGTTALTSISVPTGSAVVNGGTMRTTGAQSYGTLLLGATGTFTATDLTIATALGRSGTGNRDVTFNCSGTMSLLGSTTNIRNFTTNAGGLSVIAGPMTLSGALTLNDTLQVGTSSLALTAASAALKDIDGDGNSLSLVVSGATSITGNATGFNTFSSNASGTFSLAGDLSAAGNITLSDAVTLAGSGATRAITSTSGNVAFGSTVNGPASLVASADNGTVTFGGTVGATTALGSVTVTGPATLSGASITTTGAQTYQQLTLGANATLASTGSGTITFNGAVGPAASQTLTVNTAGATIFNAAVSGLGALTTDAAGTNTLAADLQAAGNILLNGATTLSGEARSITSATGSVTLGGTVNGATDLTLSSATGSTLSGLVGGATALNSLTIAAGPATLSGGGVTTTGAQTYGNLTLGAATTLASTSGGALNLNGTVNGAFALTLNSAGTTTLGGTVGGTTALSSLTASGPLTIQGGAVTTTGAQTYGALTLAANTTLASGSNGAITFNGTVGAVSGQTLTVNTGGGTIFNAAVSGLGALTTDATGTNTLAADLQAAGNILLNGATTLSGANRSVTSTAGSVTFGSTVNGASAFTVSSATGTTFSGAVGGTTALTSLSITGTANLNGGGIFTTGSQSTAQSRWAQPPH
ncbi:MAG: filamentous hemagglutinin N-terminal domain-containing protein [Phycisphaerales bacterium]